MDSFQSDFFDSLLLYIEENLEYDHPISRDSDTSVVPAYQNGDMEVPMVAISDDN